MPVIVLTGPRQSGKTTLVKELFADYNYVNLELPKEREFAENDPKSFLKRFKGGLIIDEVQYVPKLFSYIQVYSDEAKINGKYILTGSQNFHLMQSITQSLAGRAAIFNLLPFSIQELKAEKEIGDDYERLLINGFYPRVQADGVSPLYWYQSYIQTYMERDVRQLINVKDLSKFHLLIKLLAGRIGQILNNNSLANEIGIDIKTVKSWISILETNYLVLLVQPHFKNFGKRLIKSPKLYFTDVGLACNLLGIQNETQLETHYLKGELFENMIMMEYLKKYYNQGLQQQLYFWRDSNGNEVNLILEQGGKLQPIEIKSGRTMNSNFFKGLKRFDKIAGETVTSPQLVYGGWDSYEREGIDVLGWKDV